MRWLSVFPAHHRAGGRKVEILLRRERRIGGGPAVRSIAGMDAVVHYLEELGRRLSPEAESRRAAVFAATKAFQDYEAQLSCAMLDVLANAGATVYGITSKEQISQRTPTLCFNLPGVSQAKVTEELAKQNIGVRDGHPTGEPSREGAFPRGGHRVDRRKSRLAQPMMACSAESRADRSDR